MPETTTWETLSNVAVGYATIPAIERIPVPGGYLYRTSTVHNGCYAGQQVVFVPCQAVTTPAPQIDPDPSNRHYERGSYDNDREWIHDLCGPLGLDPGTDGREEIVAAVEKLVLESADLKTISSQAASQYR